MKSPRWTPRACATPLLVLLLSAVQVPGQDLELPPPPIAPTVILQPTAKAFRAAAEEIEQGVDAPSWYDTSNRETIRTLFNNVWAPSRNASVGWTGSLSTATNPATCVPGATSPAWSNSVATGLNFLRNLSGIAGSIALDSGTSSKDQEAALMFSANRNIDHFPPSNWTCYTANGYQASGNSNICYSSGSLRPGCLELYMDDFGSNNAAAGHRRWILYPQTQFFGNGDVPATPGFYSGNALWVFDGNYGTNRPGTREAFVSWPPPGYIPYQLIPIRWSFSYNNASFSSASVTATKDGVNLPMSLENAQNGYGENTLVFYPTGTDPSANPTHPSVNHDTVYNISINNVLISGVPQTISYTVRVFDPAVATPNQPSITSLTPTSGSGTSTVFTLQSSDPSGYTNLSVINLLINPFLDGRFSCLLAYDRALNVLYLENDNGTALLSGMVLNGSGSLGNSYCTVLGAGTSASGSGTTLTLTLNMQFNQLNYARDHVLYAAARSVTGGNSGWITSGVWRVPPASSVPTVFSQTPGSGSGSAQSFAFVFRDTANGTNISNAQLLINADLNGGSACYLGYVRATNQLYLVNDANSGLLAPITPNSGTGTAQNSQCILSGSGTTMSVSGTDLTLTVNLTFKSAFTGRKVMYSAFQTTTSANTGWQARGFWRAP